MHLAFGRIDHEAPRFLGDADRAAAARKLSGEAQIDRGRKGARIEGDQGVTARRAAHVVDGLLELGSQLGLVGGLDAEGLSVHGPSDRVEDDHPDPPRGPTDAGAAPVVTGIPAR